MSKFKVYNHSTGMKPRISPVADAVRTMSRPSKGSLQLPADDAQRQTWDALEAVSMAIRQEIQEMAENLHESVELVKVAGGVNVNEFDIAVKKTNKDLQDFTTDFLKIANSHQGRKGTVKDENELADCLEIYEKYMQFKALFNGVFHHTAILFTEFSLQAKDAMEDAMIKEAKDVAEQKAALVEEPKAIQ